MHHLGAQRYHTERRKEIYKEHLVTFKYDFDILCLYSPWQQSGLFDFTYS